MTEHWRSTETIGWTEHDGAGPAPWAPGPAAWISTAVGLSAVLGVILFSDVLCPEHRTWVQALGAASITAAAVSLAGIVRRSSWAPIATIMAACGGAGIGLIDALHAPGRGYLVALLFAAVGVTAALLASRQLALRRWERRVVVPLMASAPEPLLGNGPTPTRAVESVSVAPPVGEDAAEHSTTG